MNFINAGKGEIARSGASSSQRVVAFSRPMAAAGILVSLLQGVYFSVERPWTGYSSGGMFLVAAAAFFALKLLRRYNARLFGLVFFLLCSELILFSIKLVGTEPPFRFRLMQVAILISYISIAMAALLGSARVVAPPNAFLLFFSAGLSLLLIESLEEMWSRQSRKETMESAVEWVGPIASHPLLGQHYFPYSMIKTYYPDNPRGYFKEEDLGTGKWRLQVMEDNAAELVVLPDKPETVRIAIKKAETDAAWHIMLNQDQLSLKSNKWYTVAFRARADSPRRIASVVSQGHEPWQNLGFYSDIDLTSDWQSFQFSFVAKADDDNARIHFQVGGSNVPVEIADVSLRRLSDGVQVEAKLPKKRYVVTYKFNALGCRGRDYPISQFRDKGRILVLGDSFAMGVGVHEEDTLASQLEHLLNNRARALDSGKTYEVVNCGTSGFGTREERFFYQLYGHKYEADIVLLVMFSNDDISWADEVRLGYTMRPPGKLEYLFLTWGRIQNYRYQRPFPNYSDALKEIIELNNNLQKRGKRLATIIFRINSDPISDHLVNSVTRGLQGTDIPVLDLGEAFKNHSLDDLIVHKVDFHPNEIANALAARTVQEFLYRESLLGTPESKQMQQ